VEFGTKSGGTETVVHTVGNLVCGDAYMIERQSNALATDTVTKPRRKPVNGFAVMAARRDGMMLRLGS